MMTKREKTLSNNTPLMQPILNTKTVFFFTVLFFFEGLRAKHDKIAIILFCSSLVPQHGLNTVHYSRNEVETTRAPAPQYLSLQTSVLFMNGSLKLLTYINAPLFTV